MPSSPSSAPAATVNPPLRTEEDVRGAARRRARWDDRCFRERSRAAYRAEKRARQLGARILRAWRSRSGRMRPRCRICRWRVLLSCSRRILRASSACPRRNAWRSASPPTSRSLPTEPGPSIPRPLHRRGSARHLPAGGSREKCWRPSSGAAAISRAGVRQHDGKRQSAPRSFSPTAAVSTVTGWASKGPRSGKRSFIPA